MQIYAIPARMSAGRNRRKGFTGHAITFTAALLAASLVSGCSEPSSSTPEPSDKAAADRLIEKLGTDRTYDRKTMLMNAEPDGLVLKAWLRRREATLNHKLNINQLPALENPGSVAKTLKWERDTERAEESAPVYDLAAYSLDVNDRTALLCSRTHADEAKWYVAEQQAWASGQRTAFVDLKKVSEEFQAACDAEFAPVQAASDANRTSNEESQRAMTSLKALCNAEFARADKARTEALHTETFAGDPNAPAKSQARYLEAQGAHDRCMRVGAEQ